MAETEVTTSAGDPVKSEDNENRGKKDVSGKNKLGLTQSEEDLGIRITQPNQKTIDAMNRLYAVPSEKLRVWTCWLTKVGERAADDWQWWLRAQIGLALRMSERLQRASVVSEAEGIEKSNREEEVETTKEETELSAEADSAQDQKIIISSEQDKITDKEETGRDKESNNIVAEEDELAKEKPADGAAYAERSREREKADKKTANKEKKTKETERDKLEPKIMYEEGFWPVGVRWKPFSQRAKRKPPPQRQPDEIPIPNTEDEMMDLIRKIRHQGVIYRSLYKHWSETAEQAVKEMIGRTVLPTEQVCLKGEEIPYFFFLGSEPDLEYGIEHDDEEILAADPGRERITRDFEHLYFNLSDKPGKRGKPWL